jgi:reverse transcriptase-like protein
MASNKLWKKLCTENSLRKGWHLTRTDMKRDFAKEPFSVEIFGYSSDENIKELLRVLRTGKYNPKPLKRVAIPKGTLGTRPGTLLSVEDRVILFGALQLIAEPLDSHLKETVYSFRVNKDKKKDSLFYEGDAISLPFLKNKTVRKYIDPFDPWYGLWPKFDEISKKAFQEQNYRYMATSDIAAYFENIQLDILRELLNDLLPGEQKIINLFINSFAAWTYDTEQGRRYLRGIPQGTQISSFFGNLFLKPIDDAFEVFGENNDIKYYRYMDDIRVFTKEFDIARSAILLLDSEIRRLHLNLQSGKTKIYDELHGEVTTVLIDRRLTQIDDIEEKYRDKVKIAKEKGVEPNFSDLLIKVNRILDQKPDGNTDEQKIKGARKPLKNLTDRTFRRLLTLCLSMDSDKLTKLLLREIKINADGRLGFKLITYAKHFPRNTTIQNELLKFIVSKTNIFSYQEAQILEALRYQSRIKEELLSYCKERIKDESVDVFVLTQALRLISRCNLNADDIKMAQKLYDDFDDVTVKKAAALILIRQRGKANIDFVRSIIFHPNDDLRKLGRLIWSIKNSMSKSNYFQAQIFDHQYLLVDYIPFLYLIAESGEKKLVEGLIAEIRKTKIHKTNINMDMRDRLEQVLYFSEQNLRSK